MNYLKNDESVMLEAARNPNFDKWMKQSKMMRETSVRGLDWTGSELDDVGRRLLVVVMI